MIFINNTADKGGDVLYGGLVASGYDGDWNCLLSFKNISDMTQQSSEQPFRRITSEPSRVCLCGEGAPDCMIVVDPIYHHLYPGQTLSLSLAVVGQDFGTVYGNVYAHFQEEYASIPKDHEWVVFPNGGCQNITYTIFSDCETCEAILSLSSDRKGILQNVPSGNSWSLLLSEPNYKKLANHYIAMFLVQDDLMQSLKLSDDYERVSSINIDDFFTITPESLPSAVHLNMQDQFQNKLRFPTQIYKYPLYVNIQFQSCPPGFSLSGYKCDCNHILKHIPTVTCDIVKETISRHGSTWVGVYGNETVAVSQYCPLNYCKNQLVELTLTEHHTSNGTDSQYNYHHSGILCGGCQSGLSLTLGSEQCLHCSNLFITLILPFALAGVAVVFIIKFLDLTVCHGAINGIIFYANVISANKDLFYDQPDTNPITLFIAWFNLDLGIETCFYEGLTAYSRTWLQFVFPVYMWSIAAGIIVLAK